MKVYDAILYIILAKQNDYIVPSHACFKEIIQLVDLDTNSVKIELNRLIKQNIITFGHTINDIYFKINKP